MFRYTRTLLIALMLPAVALVAMAPSASAEAAIVVCEPIGGGGGGLVGRTVEYVSNVEYAVCTETVSYAFYVCGVVFGPSFCAIA